MIETNSNNISTAWVTFYIIIYVLQLLSLYYVVNVSVADKITLANLSSVHSHIMRFSKLKVLYIALILNLAGLPPFVLFFIKFDYVVQIFNGAPFSICATAYLLLFLHMMFYVQTLLVKNANENELIFRQPKKKPSYLMVFLITALVYLSLSSIIFFPDFQSVLNLMFA